MNPNEKPRPDYYDANGQPVYSNQPSPQQPFPQPKSEPAQQKRTSHVTAAPETVAGENYNPRIRTQYANEPKIVHTTRETEMEPFEVSDAVQKKSSESKRQYPDLNLSKGEFVILDTKRHLIGLFTPILAGAVVLFAIVFVMILYPSDTSASALPSFQTVSLIAGLVMIIIGIGIYISVWVYLQNQFFLTNESVIQRIQTSLFAKREQTVSLGSIEDASFHQTGILQTMLNYGTLRLSTEGDETTYRFSYVANPRDQISSINNAIEAFKNGRPYSLYEDIN